MFGFSEHSFTVWCKAYPDLVVLGMDLRGGKKTE